MKKKCCEVILFHNSVDQYKNNENKITVRKNEKKKPLASRHNENEQNPQILKN